MSKNKTEKIIAKAIWYAMLTITIVATILLIMSLGAIVETMSITNPYSTIATFCVIWLAIFSLFIYWSGN